MMYFVYFYVRTMPLSFEVIKESLMKFLYTRGFLKELEKEIPSQLINYLFSQGQSFLFHPEMYTLNAEVFWASCGIPYEKFTRFF